jgi:hypothetical protein
MFVSHNREKLINAIIYFTKETKHCHTLKLFKLLNFLDFENYRQTGKSVTGLEYKAWPNGPAPSELWHEFLNPRPDLAQAVLVNLVRDDMTHEPKRREIKGRRPFDSKHFTKREREIMEKLAFFFRDARGDDMSEVSHARNLPWGKVYQRGRGNGRVIPYELALESAPVIPDMPSLDRQEIERRRTLFEEIDQATVEG